MIIKENTYEPCPQGMWPAVCCDVIDLGMKDTQYGIKHKLAISFQTDQLRDDSKPYVVRRTYNVTMHPKGELCKDLVRWRGRPFTPEERCGFDLEKLIGVNCQVLVSHNIQDHGTWANVDSVLPAAKDAVKMSVDADYVRARDKAPVEDSGNGSDEETAEEEQVPF